MPTLRGHAGTSARFDPVKAQTPGERVAFTPPARDALPAFATAPDAVWSGNLREFSAAVASMTTRSAGGPIGVASIREEIERLRVGWRGLSRTRAARSSPSPAHAASRRTTPTGCGSAGLDPG